MTICCLPLINHHSSLNCKSFGGILSVMGNKEFKTHLIKLPHVSQFQERKVFSTLRIKSYNSAGTSHFPQLIFVLLLSFFSWNSVRTRTYCCQCVYIHYFLLFFQGSVMTHLHPFISCFFCHVIRIRMCLHAFQTLECDNDLRVYEG